MLHKIRSETYKLLNLSPETLRVKCLFGRLNIHINDIKFWNVIKNLRKFVEIDFELCFENCEFRCMKNFYELAQKYYKNLVSKPF